MEKLKEIRRRRRTETFFGIYLTRYTACCSCALGLTSQEMPMTEQKAFRMLCTALETMARERKQKSLADHLTLSFFNCAPNRPTSWQFALAKAQGHFLDFLTDLWRKLSEENGKSLVGKSRGDTRIPGFVYFTDSSDFMLFCQEPDVERRNSFFSWQAYVYCMHVKQDVLLKQRELVDMIKVDMIRAWDDLTCTRRVNDEVSVQNLFKVAYSILDFLAILNNLPDDFFS